MRTRLLTGAAFALAATAIGIGCGSKKTTTIGGNNGELSNNDSFPASSIASNNVAHERLRS